MDLPNLWIPKPRQFIAIPELPKLGTGKLDLRRVREVATALLQQAEQQRNEMRTG